MSTLRVTDDDNGEVTVSRDGKELRGWSYANDTEQVVDWTMRIDHRPGERFVVYKMDYGLYIDLAATDKFPTGTLFSEHETIDVMDIDVPLDDARSFRRAILDLDDFYKTHAEVIKS